MNPADEPSPHRLFAAIVLMGTGLTLGCGGVTEHERPVDPASGGSGGLGGSTSTAGDTPIGGAWPFGGGSEINIGIAGAPPAPVNPGPFACPPARWSCSGPVFCGLAGDGWALPDDCSCDPARPELASDCAEGKVFLCRDGTSTADGHPLTHSVPFECSCVDKLSLCDSECRQAFFGGGGDYVSCETSPDEARTDCGCAVVLLK